MHFLPVFELIMLTFCEINKNNKFLRQFPSCMLIRNSILFGTLEYDTQKCLLKLHNQATSSLDISVMPWHAIRGA